MYTNTHTHTHTGAAGPGRLQVSFLSPCTAHLKPKSLPHLRGLKHSCLPPVYFTHARNASERGCSNTVTTIIVVFVFTFYSGCVAFPRETLIKSSTLKCKYYANDTKQPLWTVVEGRG